MVLKRSIINQRHKLNVFLQTTWVAKSILHVGYKPPFCDFVVVNGVKIHSEFMTFRTNKIQRIHLESNKDVSHKNHY